MKLSDKIIKALDIYVKRGEEAKADVERLLEIPRTDYDWRFFKDDFDNQLAVNASTLIQNLVLMESDKQLAHKKAKWLLKVLTK